MFTQIDRLAAFAVRAEPAALEVIKQLQRASLPRAGVCALVSRNGRPDAFAVCASAALHAAMRYPVHDGVESESLKARKRGESD